MGTITPARSNIELATEVNRLCTILITKRHITWRHIRGHSDHKWNDYMDRLADTGRGGFGDVSAQGGECGKTKPPEPKNPHLSTYP